MSSSDLNSNNCTLFFLLRVFFFFCQETIYRKVAFVFPSLELKESSAAFDHSFIPIAFAQYNGIMTG